MSKYYTKRLNLRVLIYLKRIALKAKNTLRVLFL